MTLLADLTWFRVADAGHGAPAAELAASLPCQDVAPDPAALAQAAQAASTSYVVLVLPDILPRPMAAALSPEPALLATGRALLWPAENRLTGEAASTCGLWVVPARLLSRHAEAFLGSGVPATAPPALVVPRIVADWECGRSGAAAFRAAFDSMGAAEETAAALSAGLGADRPHGAWWGIGACRGLLGGDACTAWEEERSGPADPAALRQRWSELARQVRVTRGLPVYPMEADTAAALRRMRGDQVPPAIWDRFVAGLTELGPDTSRLRDACALARATIWGHPDDRT